MKIALITTTLLLCVSLNYSQRLDGYADLVERVRPSIVLVNVTDSSGRIVKRGTGFCVAPGVFITNHHVIKGAHGVSIRTSDNRTLRVRLGPSNELADVALLNVEVEVVVKPLKFAAELPKVGERILVVGNPLGLSGTVSDGIVSAIRQSGSEEFVQITAPVSQGSSGSPVLNLNGDVVGVATMIVEGGQNLNFAVSARYIESLWPGKFATRSSTVSAPKSPISSRWRLLNNDETRYDKQTLSKVGGIVSVWIRYSEEGGGYLQVLNELNCSTRKIRTTQSVAYASNGDVEKSSTSSGDWRAIIPDSNGEDYFDVFCSGNADRQSDIDLQDLFDSAEKYEEDNNLVAAVSGHWEVLRFFSETKGTDPYMSIYWVLSKSRLETIYEKSNNLAGLEKLYLFAIADGDSSDYVPLVRLYKKMRLTAKFQSTLATGIKTLENNLAAKIGSFFDYGALADLYILQNINVKATSILVAGLARFPREVYLGIKLGTLYNEQKKWRACVDLGERLLSYSEGTDRRDLLTLLKIAYAALGDLKNAAKADKELQAL